MAAHTVPPRSTDDHDCGFCDPSSHWAVVPAGAGAPAFCACGWTPHGGYWLSDHLRDVAPPEALVEQTRPFTDAERAELGDRLAADALAGTVFDRIERHRVLANAADAGVWLTDTQVAERVAELRERDRADALVAQAVAAAWIGRAL